MIRRLGFAIAAMWIATLVAVAVIATSVSGSSAAGSRRVAQPVLADAGTVRPEAPVATVATTVPTTVPTSVAPVITVAPTTTPTTKAAPPAPAVTRAPQPVATTAVRPAVVAAPPARIVATPSSGGSASDFSLIGYRWSPCQTITVNSTGPDVTGIVSELASITGLRLTVVGGPAQINVQWGSVPPGGEIGFTAWKAVGGWLTAAGITISHGADPYLATVLRHELGHALGLGHATRGNEVMYGNIGSTSPTDYQAGDLAGLHSVGASAGC
jgi:hypothetical protein